MIAAIRVFASAGIIAPHDADTVADGFADFMSQSPPELPLRAAMR